MLGTLIGIIPATGANVACFLSYDLTKRFSKHPDTFGKGDVEGVITSECANNAVCGGAMVPLLTLGIPGDGVTAILLGGLMILNPFISLLSVPLIIGNNIPLSSAFLRVCWSVP